MAIPMVIDPRPLALELVDEFVGWITGQNGSQPAKIGPIESAVLRRYLPKIKKEIEKADVNERLEMFEFLDRMNQKLTEGLRDDQTTQASQGEGVIARTSAPDDQGRLGRRAGYRSPGRRR